MKKMIVMLFVLVTQMSIISAQTPGAVKSIKPEWRKIGDVVASFKLENESIIVTGAGKFRSIKLKVTDAPLNMEILEIYYESGEVEKVAIQKALQTGEETNVIDIKSNKALKKVVFTYKTPPASKDDKVHVELYGLK